AFLRELDEVDRAAGQLRGLLAHRHADAHRVDLVPGLSGSQGRRPDLAVSRLEEVPGLDDLGQAVDVGETGQHGSEQRMSWIHARLRLRSAYQAVSSSGDRPSGGASSSSGVGSREAGATGP